MCFAFRDGSTYLDGWNAEANGGFAAVLDLGASFHANSSTT